MDEFENELRTALRRVEAPVSLKAGLMERRRFQQRRTNRWLWQRMAASLLIVAVLGGGLYWRHQVEEERKGEEARRQVLEALRITSQALDQMNVRLQQHSNAKQEE